MALGKSSESKMLFFNSRIPESKNKSTKELVKAVNELIVKGNDENLDVDPEKLRKYELDRLKYYYAIIECDSAETADSIHKSMND
jgi:hypothetical protein